MTLIKRCCRSLWVSQRLRMYYVSLRKKLSELREDTFVPPTVLGRGRRPYTSCSVLMTPLPRPCHAQSLTHARFCRSGMKRRTISPLFFEIGHPMCDAYLPYEANAMLTVSLLSSLRLLVLQAREDRPKSNCLDIVAQARLERDALRAQQHVRAP